MKLRGVLCAAVSLLLIVAGVALVGCESHPSEGSFAYTASPGLGMGSHRSLRSGGSEPRAVPNTGMGLEQQVDEVWVIQRADGDAPAEAAEDTPRSGALLARVPGQEAPVGFPLKHTNVQAEILGYVATVNVTQQYHNPYSSKIEAVYVFPLPSDAAVTDFVMTIGERRIRGIIREREEAERIYYDARAQGYTASLLTQERPNIFTQKVANIEPGKQIDVDITYFHTLAYVDGWYEWVFPMVVGPRFNPPGSTDGIGAVGTGVPGRSRQPTEVQYLRPGAERSGHDISLSVRVNVGVPIEQIDSRNHEVTIQASDAGVAEVTLSPEDSIPNKDFVLRYRVAGDRLKSAVMAQRYGEDGGYFTLMLFPPQTINDLPRKPLELVFTLDVSGSMMGEPIEQSKAAIRYALQHMNAGDTFQVIRFAGSAEQLFGKPQPATGNNIRKGLRYIENMQAGGGTMMIEGIRKSLNYPHDPDRLRFVCFLTDGYIGNEAEILREIHEQRGPSRIFSFGVGSSTNRYLLDHMARFGFGTVAYLGLNDDAEAVMAGWFERIAHPAMTNIEIDWNGLDVQDVYPSRVPDLFVGRPVILTGRFRGDGQATIRVKGKVGGETHVMEIPVRLDESAPEHGGLRQVWARTRIQDLADRSIYDQSPELPQEIRQVALEYGLVSPFTAFVAVDSSHRTAGEQGTTIAVPVPMPEGVEYETTVRE